MCQSVGQTSIRPRPILHSHSTICGVQRSHQAYSNSDWVQETCLAQHIGYSNVYNVPW